MRLGVIAAGLTPVTTALLLHLCNRYRQHTFILFFDAAPPAGLQLPANASAVTVPLKGSGALQRYRWREWQLPRALKQQQVQLLLGMDGVLPRRNRLPACLLVPDTFFLHDTAGMPPRRRRFLQRHTAASIERAELVFVLSHTTRQELLQFAPGAAGKMHGLPPGLDPAYQPLEWEPREAAKKEFAGGTEYFAVMASLHPRNNILPLLKAFSALKRRLHSNMKLVLAGEVTPAGEDIAASLSTYRFRNDVVWLQHPGPHELARMVGGAYALIYTPRYDSVATPVYAALKCEVPVIAIDGPAAREAGGDAALYTDPANLEDLADTMCLLYKDEQLRSRQLQKIAAGALPIGWDAAADALMSRVHEHFSTLS